MIGGKIIEVRQDRLWVVDRHGQEMCVNIENDAGVRLPRLGESVWWQSGRVFYGGPDKARGEISLRKVGYSHSPEDFS
jgi:hypothetical protein